MDARTGEATLYRSGVTNPESPHTILVCYRCDSTERIEFHSKVMCARCYAVIENCCGD